MTFRSPRIAQSASRRPVTPLHRGPQAVSQPVAGSHTVQHAPNAALLIDFDNVTMGIRSDLQTELKNLLASDIIKGKVSVQRAYADWRRYPQYIVPLAESSIDMIMAPAYGSSKKNATDIRLAIDALELVFTRPEIGTFILLSGDSDFSSLVIKLKEYGKYVIGVGIRESSSDLLVMNCDEYYSYNSLAGLMKSGEEDVVKHDPWELVSEAVQRMKRNGDVMRADRLKQVMQQIDSSFDEKNVGKSKFSLFVAEAARRGLLSLNKLDNGQLEIDLPRTEPAEKTGSTAASLVGASVTAPAPATEVAAEERRPRRGRGRGRDRDVRGGRAERAERDTPVEAGATAPASAAAARPSAPAPAEAGDEIGASGLRLTREQAFELVRQAVASLVSGDSAVPARAVRSAARSILGQDSESLNERNFLRILHDAHDANVIDLRKRGQDYEVATAAGATPVAAQLGAAQAAATPVVKPAAPLPPGMGARGLGRGGPRARRAEPPANLLSVGVVGSRSTAAAAVTQPPVTPSPAAASAEPAAATEPRAGETAPVQTEAGAKRVPAARRKTARKKSPARKQAPRKSAARSGTEPEGGETSAPAARKRPARGTRRRATVRPAGTPEGSGTE